MEDVLNVGDKVEVELAEIDPRGKLSLHAVLTEEQLAAEKEAEAGQKETRPERRERGRRPRERRRTRSAAPKKEETDSQSEE